jgi:hypothetical protein
VKPTNLMMAGEQVKLVDFGIARRAVGPRVTKTGMHIGTAGYMAPEQARGEPEVTGAADMFAVGCVLYECLAGVPAFRGDSAMALRAKVLLHDPLPLRALAPSLPVALDELVMALLAREAERRPTAGEVEAALAATEVDALGPVVRAADVVTEASRGSEGPACAILVAVDDPAALDGVPALAGGTAQRFAGGAVTTRADVGEAARLALEIAAQLPDAMIAVAWGRSSGEAIDRSARLIEQLEIAAVAGKAVAGAWVDGDVVAELGDAFEVEAHGGRVRLRGLA